MTDEKKPNPLKRLSGAGIQMGLTIALFAWGGSKLDEGNEGKPLYTVVFSLLGVFIGLYLMIKEVLKISKDD
jgi:hypothetical protein